MIINFLKEDSITLLKEIDLSKNVNYYGNDDNSWILRKYHNDNLFQKFDKKEFNDFELIKSDNPKDDFENMKILYESLKDLTDSQASDERIWSGLAHTYCWDYMQKRWALPTDDKKKNSHVLNNYFFWNSTKAEFLNGLSRLWWYARFTYEEGKDDPFELTKYICENDINGKIFPLLSCRFANNREVFKNIIRAVKSFEEENSYKLSRDEFNDMKTYLNRLSGIYLLDIFNYDDIKSKIYGYLNKKVLR